MRRLSESPLHLILGIDLIATGVTLVSHHHYFFWPPHPEVITAILNDSVVGTLGIATGIGMIAWAFAKSKSLTANRWMIAVATAYYTLLSATEFAHAFFARAGEPHMYVSGIGELAMACLALYMAKQSPSGEEGDDKDK